MSKPYVKKQKQGKFIKLSTITSAIIAQGSILINMKIFNLVMMG